MSVGGEKMDTAAQAASSASRNLASMRFHASTPRLSPCRLAGNPQGGGLRSTPNE